MAQQTEQKEEKISHIPIFSRFHQTTPHSMLFHKKNRNNNNLLT